MAKIKILYILLFCGLTVTLYSQPFEKPSTYEIPQQSVYLELGGNGIIYSLNYDVLFKNGYGVRLGGSYLYERMGWVNRNDRGSFSQIESNAILGFVMGHKMFGKTSNKLELGTGLLFGTIYEPTDWDFIKPPGLTFSAGYRFYPSDPGKFTFKAAFTPVLTRDGFHPRFGVSFGVTLTPEGNTH